MMGCATQGNALYRHCEYRRFFGRYSITVCIESFGALTLLAALTDIGHPVRGSLAITVPGCSSPEDLWRAGVTWSDLW